MLDHEVRYRSAVNGDVIATVFSAVAVSEQYAYMLEVSDSTSAFMAVIELRVECVTYYRMHRAMLHLLALPFTRIQSGVISCGDGNNSEVHYLLVLKEFARGDKVPDAHDGFMRDVSSIVDRLNSDQIQSALIGTERLFELCGAIVGARFSGKVNDDVTLAETFHELVADSTVYSKSGKELANVESYSAQQMTPAGSTARVLFELRSAKISCPWHLRTHCMEMVGGRDGVEFSSWTSISAVAPSLSDRKSLASAVTFLEYDGFCLQSDGRNSPLFNLLGMPGVHACALNRTVGRFKGCSRDTAARRLVMFEDAEQVAQPMNADLDGSLRGFELAGMRNVFIAYSGAGLAEAAGLLNGACDIAVWNPSDSSFTAFVAEQCDGGHFKKSYTRCQVVLLMLGESARVDWFASHVSDLALEAQQLGAYLFAIVNPSAVTQKAAVALNQSLCFLLPSGNTQHMRDLFMNGIDLSASDELYYTLDTNEKPADGMVTVFIRLASTFQKTAVRMGL